MPIECSHTIRVKDQEEFHLIDNQIMKQAFDIHNDYGRFYEEHIYNKQLNLYAEQSGLNAESEVAVKVSHKDFKKYYYLDRHSLDISAVQSVLLEKILKELLSDWGTFLDFNLYKEALVYFLGGKESIVRNINIINKSKIIGQQKVVMLSDDTVMHISGLSTSLEHYKKHMYRFLSHTHLSTIQ